MGINNHPFLIYYTYPPRQEENECLFYLNRLCSTRVSNAAYQVSRSSAFWFLRRSFKGFYHTCIWAWQPSWVMWPGPFEQTFVPPSPRSSVWNLTLEMFKVCGRRKPTYPISSPVSLRLSWADKLPCFLPSWVIQMFPWWPLWKQQHQSWTQCWCSLRGSVFCWSTK